MTPALWQDRLACIHYEVMRRRLAVQLREAQAAYDEARGVVAQEAARVRYAGWSA